MLEIPMVNTDKLFLIDNEDYDKVKMFDWRLKDGEYPVVYNRGDHYLAPVHRVILNSSKDDGIEIDHINRDTLDNRKANLRPVTRSQNMMNRAKLNREDNTSSYKGVRYLSDKDYYQVRISASKKTITIGHYFDEVASANMYNHYAKRLHGEYAVLNDIPYMEEAECELHKVTRRRKVKQ